MIGEVVVSRDSGGCVNVGFFVAAGLSCLIALGAAEVGWAVFALLPFCIGMAGLLAADPTVVFEVKEEGLSFDKPTESFIPYESLRGLSGGRDLPIQVYHDGGVVRIPPTLNISARQLYEFLLEKLPWRAEPDAGPVAGSLREFVKAQVDLFGADKVYVFRPRPFPPVHTKRKPVGYSLGVVAGSALWVASGIALEIADLKGGGWIAAGIILGVFSGVFALLFAKSGGGRAWDWQESCLVVSPGGIALVQGHHRGKLRWDELRAIDYPMKAGAGHAGTGIGLRVAGAVVLIADYYDRPLSEIRRCLEHYWGGQEKN